MHTARTVPNLGVIAHTLAHGATRLVVLALLGTPLLAQTPAGETDDAFAKGAWHRELGAHVGIETWNYNISHETMYGGSVGLSYGLGKGVALVLSAPLLHRAAHAGCVAPGVHLGRALARPRAEAPVAVPGG